MGLFDQFLNQANSEVLFGMRNTQMAWMLGMHKDVVGAFRTSQDPSIFQKFLAFHSRMIHTIHMNRGASLKISRLVGG